MFSAKVGVTALYDQQGSDCSAVIKLEQHLKKSIKQSNEILSC